MQTIVYSKEGACIFCSKAKMLLKKHNISFEERKIDTTSEESIKKAEKELGQENIRTVPQIVLNGEYIGGYTELEKYLLKR